MGAATVNGIDRIVVEVLADALRLDLEVSPAGRLSGSAKFKYEAKSLGLKGALEAKVVSSFKSVNGEDAGVLLKIMGDLHLFVFASNFDKQIKLNVLDQSRASKGSEFGGLFEARSVRGLSKALEALPEPVARFHRDFAETHWTKG